MHYRVTFDRIGRNHNPEPLETKAKSLDHLVDKIYLHVRGKLISRAVDVTLDPESSKGVILAGFHEAGRFAYEETS